MKDNDTRKDFQRKKVEKTVTRKHVERRISGELLAIDPQHKPRGGYKRLMHVIMQDEYYDEPNDCE